MNLIVSAIGAIIAFFSGWGAYAIIEGLLHSASSGSILGVLVFGFLAYIFLLILIVVCIFGLVILFWGLVD